MDAPHYRSIYTFLWHLIKPFKWHYLAMLSAPILGASYDFLNNYSLKLIIDAFSTNAQLSYTDLAWPIGIFIFSQISLDVFWRSSDIAEWRAEPYVRQNILNETYGFIQNHPYWFFQNTPSGSITSRIKGILDGYDNFWASAHHDFTPKIANTVVLSAVLAVVSWKVCLLVSVWALVFIGTMYWLSLTLDKLSFVNAEHRHSILGLVADNISNIFTIFSFATKKHELKRLNESIEKDFIPSTVKVYKFSFMLHSFAAVLYWIMLITLLFYMIHLRNIGEATNGDFVFVMGITFRLAMELWLMIQKMQNFMKNVGDFKSSFEIMKTAQDPREQIELPALNISNASIAFDKVSFSYDGDRHVFSDLSLTIKPGEKIGLVGISGAGKSTFVSLLLKYFSPRQGRILIDGNDTAQFSTDSVRENIAVIPQDIMLFHRSIGENIGYGRIDATKDEIIEAARMANIHEFIMSLPEQYDALVGERGVKLSGGQRQRIAIARAILKHAPILILDEATSSLDTETEQLIQNSLNALLDDKQTTVVAIAHRLSTLKHMDRIIVLEHGKIVEEGTHDVLTRQGKLYQKLWELQKMA